MRTDALIAVADSIQADKYFEMSDGQNEHGMLGHLSSLPGWGDLRIRSRYPSFRKGVCSAVGMSDMDYLEIFYPKSHDANWRANTQKAEKGHITAEMASRFLRNVAMLYEESRFELGRSISEIKFFPVSVQVSKSPLTQETYRRLWSMARYQRNLNYDLISKVQRRLFDDIIVGNNKQTAINMAHTHGYYGSYPSVPMALADYFLSELGWPDAPSINSKLNVISDATLLPISELRRIFATEYDMDGYSYSARESNKLCWISPEHAYHMLEFLRSTGMVSWRIAKQLEESSESL